MKDGKTRDRSTKMALFTSKSKDTNGKTRPIELKDETKKVVEDDLEEELELLEAKLAAKEDQIQLYRAELHQRELEIVRLNQQMAQNVEFLQRAILELIALKGNLPVLPAQSSVPVRALDRLAAERAQKSEVPGNATPLAGPAAGAKLP